MLPRPAIAVLAAFQRGKSPSNCGGCGDAGTSHDGRYLMTDMAEVAAEWRGRTSLKMVTVVAEADWVLLAIHPAKVACHGMMTKASSHINFRTYVHTGQVFSVRRFKR